MSFKHIYLNIINVLILFLFIFLLDIKSLPLYAVIYSITALLLILHMIFSVNKKSTKAIFILIYIMIMSFQQVFNVMVCFSGTTEGILFLLKKFIGILLIFIPFFVLYLNYLYSLSKQFFPSREDASTISFELLSDAYSGALSLKENIMKNKNALRTENLNEIARDIPRHSYSKYLNRNTLTEEYFDECRKNLEDEYLYVIISSTGSPASELISVFTQKSFNHVSLSFDRELKTIISYNGGENVAPPGLNRERLESFCKKDDALVMVYGLKATKEKKQLIIDTIYEINKKGSAYNLVGLVTKISIRPNIMFCSQFVYNMLKKAELQYFQSAATKVRPSDFIEKDYYRKLEYCYELKFKELNLDFHD